MIVNKGILKQDYVSIYSLQKHNIGIPIFQRFYDWKEKQTDALLEDISLSIQENNDKEIYLLDLIYFVEDGIYKFADGQQRIVTINLLIKAINDYIKNNSLNIHFVEQFNITYDVPFFNKKYNECINNYPVSPFKKNYIHFYQWIEENKDDLEKIIDVIKNKIYVFIKKTESIDDAFTIFQQINTGGKPLTKEEVIESTIAQYSEIYRISINVSVKELKKIILSYYKFLYSSNTNDFDTISIMSFLRKDIVYSKATFKKFADTLTVLKSLANNPMTSIINYINRSQLFDILYILGMSQIDVFVKRQYLDYVMFPLCLLSICMTLKKSNPGGIIKTLYSGVIEKIKSNASPMMIGEFISKFINENPEICKIDYAEFERCLGSPDVKLGIKKSILIIDVIMKNVSTIVNVPSINLEHIYPQKPDSQWATENWPTNYEKQKELSENIGNYILLNEEVNKRIKNKYIDYKIDEYNRIIKQDLSLGTEINTVDFAKFKLGKEDYIISRQKYIAEHVYSNFKLAQVMIVKK